MSGKERTDDSAVDFRFLLSQVWGEPRDRKLSAEEMATRRDERVPQDVRSSGKRVDTLFLKLQPTHCELDARTHGRHLLDGGGRAPLLAVGDLEAVDRRP